MLNDFKLLPGYEVWYLLYKGEISRVFQQHPEIHEFLSEDDFAMDCYFEDLYFEEEPVSEDPQPSAEDSLPERFDNNENEDPEEICH